MPGRDPAKGARDTGRTDRGMRDSQTRDRDRTGLRGAGALSSKTGRFENRADVTAGHYRGDSKARGTTDLETALSLASANNAYNNRSLGWKVADAVLGPFLDVKKPTLGQPQSYSGGTFHTATNPGGVLGSAASVLSGVPMLGFLGSSAYTAAHLPEVYHGGTGPQYADGNNWGGASGTFDSSPQGPGGPQGQGNQNGGQGLSAFPSIPGGASFGAQPTQPTQPAQPPKPSPVASAFGIPNHSLPQGYASMFPDSLTDRDKQLLYAKALA